MLKNNSVINKRIDGLINDVNEYNKKNRKLFNDFVSKTKEDIKKINENSVEFENKLIKFNEELIKLQRENNELKNELSHKKAGRKKRTINEVLEKDESSLKKVKVNGNNHDDDEKDFYYVRLCATCKNDDDCRVKGLSADFVFKNQKLYDIYDENYFDELYEKFNDYLKDNGYEQWYVDDTIEPERGLKKEEAINPIKINE